MRNWPSLFPQHAVTESANDKYEPVVLNEKDADRMRYAMDGSPWSFISPFLDLPDTFNMRTTATAWNVAAKYYCGELLFFLLH